jgi:hypothetical protein
MVLNKFHFQLAKFKFVESSSSFDWDGEDTIDSKGEFMIFELILRDKKIMFDIEFDIYASCNWKLERGDYYTPDEYYQTNVDVDVTITGVISEMVDLDLDLKDKEVYSLLKKLVSSKIDL